MEEYLSRGDLDGARDYLSQLERGSGSETQIYKEAKAMIDRKEAKKQ